MKKSIMFLIVFFPFAKYCSGQSDTIFNQIDEHGFKQGYWKRTMTNNNRIYLYAIEIYMNDKRNGLCIYFFPNGTKSTESHYRNDTLDGLSTIYRDYGSIRYEENFKDGKTDGFKRYYSVDGNLTEEQEYKEGVQTGIYRLYSKTKRVVVESFYVDGIENGTRRVYRDNEKHQIIREFDFKNDIKVEARYYKNGKIVKQEAHNYEDGLKKAEELEKKSKTIDG